MTALVPYIGYDNASCVANKPLLSDLSVAELVRQERLLNDIELVAILFPCDMTDNR